MARNRFGIEFSGFDEYIKKLDAIGGGAAVKKGAEEALIASKKHINPKIESAMQKGNLPAQGRYSTGETLRSLDADMDIDWKNLTASIKIGFDMNVSGMKSIYLIYGTPRMKPVKGLKDILFGAQTRFELAKIQQEAMTEAVKKVMEG